MRQLIFIFILLAPTISVGQYDYYFLKETFFCRQPSARAEAMGRSYVSIDGDMTSSFFNPAGTATIKGLEINGSFASPFYLAKDAKYRFFNAGYKIKDYLIIGLSSNRFKLGDTVFLADPSGNIIGPGKVPTNSTYSLTLSSQPIKNLYLGLNANYFIWSPGVAKETQTLYFDFGVIKKFEFLKKEASSHSINIGASIVNFNSSQISLDYYGKKINNYLPVITRYGTNYQFTVDEHVLIDTLKTVTILVHGEYQDLLNSDYESGVHAGLEVMFFEILSIRAGYYEEKVYDYGLPLSNNSLIASFTYGLGLQLPLNKLTKIPITINVDYTSLPQPSYAAPANYKPMDNFNTFNFRLNWIFKK